MTLLEFYQAAGVPDAHLLEFAHGVQMPKTPWPHQIAGLNQALVHNRYGFFGEPATAKTLPSQAWLLYMAHWGNKCLVIMPPTLLEQYAGTLSTDYPGLDDHFTRHLLSETPAQRRKLYQQWNVGAWPDILLLSYQMFLREWQVLQQAGYEVVVADEAQYLRNPQAKTHQAIQEVTAQGALLPMTGTPLHDSAMDAYGMTQLLDKTIYRSKSLFEGSHCIHVLLRIPGKGGYRKELTGFKNLDLLNRNLYRQAQRVLKSDVFPDMTEPMLVEVPYHLERKHKELYDQFVRERLLEVDGELVDALTQQSLRAKCMQMVCCPETFVDSDKTIGNSTLEMVDTLLSGIGIKAMNKCLLFAHNRATIEALAKRYHKLQPAILYGGTARAKRNSEKMKFINRNSCRLLIANYKSGGVGVDGLQDVCHYSIFVEPTPVPGDFKQALERLQRPGQQNVVTAWLLRAMATVYSRTTKKMLKKERDNIEANMDRTTIFRDLMGELS
jgi:SNF2 family DNA or RNA helicase